MFCRLRTFMRLYLLRRRGCNGGNIEQMCPPCLSLSSTFTPRNTGTGVSSCRLWSPDRPTRLPQMQVVCGIARPYRKSPCLCLGSVVYHMTI